jgi:hypothetical protein
MESLIKLLNEEDRLISMIKKSEELISFWSMESTRVDASERDMCKRMRDHCDSERRRYLGELSKLQVRLGDRIQSLLP